jgi:hypothetical protein
MVAAGVPSRIEYWKVKALANRACSTTRIVSSKSSSVSPGKPTMMSVEIAACGMRSRTRSRMPRKRSLRYERRIALQDAVGPRLQRHVQLRHDGGVSAMASMTSSVKAAGCGLVKRMRSSPDLARRHAAACRTPDGRRTRRRSC